MKLVELLTYTKRSGASDLHLSTGNPPLVRLHGTLRRIKGAPETPLSKDQVKGILLQGLSAAQRSTLEQTRELDFALEVPRVARFRGNCFFQKNGLAAVFRVIPTKILTMQELKLPKSIQEFAALEKGMVLVTGPTGSGKSTTLAALINHINETESRHILTIEDPIEFVHPPKKSLVNQREVGPNTLSFANALKGALREDPDVILVGEMRDQETIGLALTAAETGHLVFGTLHTMSAPKTVSRIVDVFPAGDKPTIQAMLADSLQGVVAQILLPTKDGKGRIAVQEIMVCTPAVRSLVRDDKIFQIPTLLQTGKKYGMQSMEQELRRVLAEGLVDFDEVARRISDPDLLGKLL